jgi:glycosyltransferase involved in cell wall biosynthesis
MGNFLYPEGMASTKRIQHFIDYLKNYNISIKLLLLRQGSQKLPKSQLNGNNEGVYFKTIGNDLSFSPFFIFSLFSYLIQGSMCLVRWKVETDKNILYCYGGLNIENYWFILFAKMMQYKIVIDVTEDYSLFEGPTKLLTRIKMLTPAVIYKTISKLADGIVVISLYLKHKYEQEIPASIPIKLIPVSAKIQSIEHKKTFRTPIKIVYAGSYASKDGVDDLIDAFGNLYEKQKNINLLLTGTGNRSSIDRIRRKIEKMEGVKYVGYLRDDDFYRFLAKADILCMIRTASRFANAGFPFKLAEYLATGNPVIASNVSNISHYLTHKKDLVLVEPENLIEIERALQYLLDDPARALKIGISGKKKSAELFNPTRNGRVLLELLKGV